MQIPAKLHYAALAMLELASTEERPQPLALREITQRHGIPQPFLVQILQQLKSAGLVTSTRGSQGGYRLLVDASEVRCGQSPKLSVVKTQVVVPKAVQTMHPGSWEKCGIVQPTRIVKCYRQ